MTRPLLGRLSASEGKRRETKVAIIGAGEIVRTAHLPAYRSVGIDICGIFDANEDRANRLAREHGVHQYRSLEDLLGDGAASLVDIAVPPRIQAELLPRVVESGKHVLAQKPLARSLREAVDLVEAAERAGVVLGVNQQMRWGPAVRQASLLHSRGVLGQPTVARFETSLAMPPVLESHWIASEPRLAVLFNTIHFIDSARYLYGTCERVEARLWREGGFDAVGENQADVRLSFTSGVTVTIEERRFAVGPQTSRFCFAGTLGRLEGRFGMWAKAGSSSPDEMFLQIGDTRERLTDPANWVPDAFRGPISEVVRAIGAGDEPSISGRDHLNTLAIVEACYSSSDRGAAVDPLVVSTPTTAA